MTYTDCTGETFDLAVEGDDVPMGWTVGYWDGVDGPVFVWHDGTMMIPTNDLRPEWGSNGEPSGRWINAETGAILVDGPVPNGTFGTGCAVLDSDTNEVILTTATPEQWWASQANDEGHILIDAQGRVVVEGTWAAQQPGVRKVYVR